MAIKSRIQAAYLSHSLPDFHNFHADETILVCGCGTSLNELKNPEKFITIGVNDIGRKFDPTYLVVLNPPEQFRNDRFRYVQQSRSEVIFTQLNLGIQHPHIVRFKLGQRGGTDFLNPNVLNYTRNSPYVALCLAIHMGAKRIGLIGVDFTDDHFFAKTGHHALTHQLVQISHEYRLLNEACIKGGIEVVNLSQQSRLTAFKKMSLATFNHSSADEGVIKTTSNTVEQMGHVSDFKQPSKGLQKDVSMFIAIKKHKPGIVGDFMDALAESTLQLGYTVSRESRDLPKSDLSIVWNGRSHRSTQPTIYCEHAWLPRWHYQMSPGGINADSHFAPFVWDGKALDYIKRAEVLHHLEAIRSGGPEEFSYMQTASEAVQDLPEAFLLVPFQMEWDTNIQRHVPQRFRKMQALIDYISHANPPMPVVYKQHPADIRRGHQQLKLHLSRSQDLIRPHTKSNIHQILKSGRCSGIISLNSNVVHDGLLWGIPSVVLGNNIWSNKGNAPFLNALPRDDWSMLFNAFERPEVVACCDAYAYYLMQNQWTLENARDPEKLAAFLSQVLPEFVSVSQQVVTQKLVSTTLKRSDLPTINVVAANLGWFFEDLKQHFKKQSGKCAHIEISERPLQQADGWIFIRTKEAASSPDPKRSVVQIHDMFDNGLYRSGNERGGVNACGTVVLTHPDQKNILQKDGVNLENKQIAVKPIGALQAFSLRHSMSKKFVVAWVGRPAKHLGTDVKRIEWFEQAVEALKGEVRVVLLGDRLDASFKKLRTKMDCVYYARADVSIDDYPKIYQDFDCVVISSVSEAGPLCLFEALAMGIPVVSTPVGWAPQLIKNGVNGFLVENIEAMSEAIENIREHRDEWYQRKDKIRASLGDITLEKWVDDNIRLATELLTLQTVRSQV